MDPRTPEYWQQVYDTESRPGWDMDAPTPLVAELLEVGNPGPGIAVAVPGCGFGHDAAELARRGFRVTAFDFAAAALEGARARYGTSVAWRQDDWFTTPAGPFDAVFDHTCFVAMEPGRREAYVARTAELLVPGGLWLLAAFHDVQGRPGPPFALPAADLRAVAESRFDVLHLAPATRSHPRRAGREMLLVGRRR
ncbi:MAG TPA: methyltransferase domain-containing protein [Holophagaceae bacterium]|nr:methyltransferase domain-containing protein [Holophagaceae bacterium]